MPTLPTNRTVANTAAEHVADHNTLHALYSAQNGTAQTFRRTVVSGVGNIVTTSASRTPIDATNLGYLTLDLAVGDLVECTFAAAVDHSVIGSAIRFDVEVDQPISANIYVASANDGGVAEMISNRASSWIPTLWYVTFVATEAGIHGFRPVWWTSAATAAIRNAASGVGDSAISWVVKKWPGTLVS